jgi:hypothetical protein
MKSASSNNTTMDNYAAVTVDVVAEEETEKGYSPTGKSPVKSENGSQNGHHSTASSNGPTENTARNTTQNNNAQKNATEKNGSSAGGGLVRSGQSFSNFLAPLTKDTFVEVAKDVEEKLKTVNQTLTMLDNILDSEGFDAILDEMLRSITLKTGELLNADRTTIWLLDEERDQIWSIVAKGEDGKPLELRIPKTAGIAGECATKKEVINIPFDFYEDPRSHAAKEFDKKNHYRTYTMLVMPLENEETGELVAVVQLINKLKPEHKQGETLEEQIDKAGFTGEDEQVFREFAPSIRLILESSKSFYAATQR